MKPLVPGTAALKWFSRSKTAGTGSQSMLGRSSEFNSATPTTPNSSSSNRHYKVKEVLEECTTDTGRPEYKVKWVGYTD